MQRKQQVGECWVYVIFFACMCVGASGSTTVSDDPSSNGLCVMCVGRFLRGSQGGQVCPPLVTRSVRGNALKSVFGWFLLFLADFAIFNSFLN
jgi:hypothetical protein